MAVTYQTEGVKMPDIKKGKQRNGLNPWLPHMAKKSVKSRIFSVRTKNTGGKSPISATRLLHGYHYFRLL